MLYNRNKQSPSIFDNFFSPEFFDRLESKDLQTVATNIAEEEGSYRIELVVPGWKSDDFEVSLENNLLTVLANTKAEKEEEEKNYIRKEFYQKQFVKRFEIPENVNQDAVNVTYEEGILKFMLPKKEIDVTKAKRLLKVGVE